MGPAFDINEGAWDPRRDSANERLSLIGELDPVILSHPSQLLDPSRRTVNNQPLGARRAELLLGCTFNDLEAFVNRINAYANYDDDAEVDALRVATAELEAMLGRCRQAGSDSDERAIEHMPVAERRRARALVLRIDALRMQRYDPVVVRRRHATAAVPSLEAAHDGALEAGDATEALRLRRLLARAQFELDQIATLVATVEATAST